MIERGSQFETRQSRVVYLSDLGHSFSFLDLSQKMGVDYEVVLAVARELDEVLRNGEWDGSSRNLDIYYGLEPQEVLQIAAICAAPWRWEFPPQGRGL